MKIFALILTYNSDKFINKVLDSIPVNFFDKIICSDDGSNDQTINLIENKKITLVKNNHGGYGSNLFSGLQKCFDEKATHVIEIHGDGQYDLKFVENMIQKFKEDNDLVLGNRFYEKKKALENGMPSYIYYGNKFLTFIGSIGLNIKSNDLFPGFRGYSKNFFDIIKTANFSPGYQFSLEIIAKSHFEKLKISSVPCENNYDGVTAPLSYTIICLIHLFWVCFLYRLAKMGKKFYFFKQ